MNKLIKYLQLILENGIFEFRMNIIDYNHGKTVQDANKDHVQNE